MPWRLIVTKLAAKDLEGLPKRDRDAVITALDKLLSDPRSVDLRKLAGREGEWRLRVGRWRVLLRMENAAGLITVQRILPRSSAYQA